MRLVPQSDRLGKETLEPEKNKTPNNGLYVILIEEGIILTHGIRIRPLLICPDDGVLV